MSDWYRPDALPTGDVRAVDDDNNNDASWVKTELSTDTEHVPLQDEVHQLLSAGKKSLPLRGFEKSSIGGLKKPKTMLKLWYSMNHLHYKMIAPTHWSLMRLCAMKCNGY